jgi:predicted MFS family arabinose efflux permease
MTIPSRYKWIVVAMLWCVCFLNYANRQLIFTVFPLLGAEFRLTDASLSIVSASFMCAYALFGPIGGMACDRFSRRSLILGALVFWSGTTVLTAFVHSYLLLVLGIALSGVGEAFYFPAAMSMIADYHAVDTRSRAMALHQSSVYIGSIVGGALAGYLGQYFGWRMGFRAFGLVGLVLGCVLWPLLKEPRRGLSDGDVGVVPNRRAVDSVLTIMRNRTVWLLIAVFIGANFVAMIFTVWLPTYLFRRFHLSLSMSGFSGTAYLQIASVIGVVSGGVWADRRVRQRPGDRGSRMAVQALGLLCGTPFLLLSGWAAMVSVVIAAMIGFGMFKGVYDSNLWASLYDVISVDQRGTTLGLMNSLGWLGGAAAQLCMGFASARYGMGACLSATALIYLVLGVVMWVGSRRVTQLTYSPVVHSC